METLEAMPARAVGVIGIPTSAGAFAPGQEQAPQALREAGLIDVRLRPTFQLKA